MLLLLWLVIMSIIVSIIQFILLPVVRIFDPKLNSYHRCVNSGVATCTNLAFVQQTSELMKTLQNQRIHLLFQLSPILQRHCQGSFARGTAGLQPTKKSQLGNIRNSNVLESKAQHTQTTECTFELSTTTLIVQGEENYPTDRNLVLVSNHQSVLDAFVFAALGCHHNFKVRETRLTQ